MLLARQFLMPWRNCFPFLELVCGERRTDTISLSYVRGGPANIVLKYKNTIGLAAQIRRRLRSADSFKWPEFDVVAEALNLPPSTLRRRLGDEGQSYQAIKDQIRRDMAIDYLCHTSKSEAEIAAELGFSEASTFHRAFKKWAGASPGEYRQMARVAAS